MTKEKHRKRHEELHNCLDELLADYLTITGKLPSETSLMEFLHWSHLQMLEPTQPPGTTYDDEKPQEGASATGTQGESTPSCADGPALSGSAP
jgi:hypothetical protein